MGKLTHTVSGSIASFKSADKANIESLKVYFNPIQSGSGDPSPENIREISGQTQLNITHCGINLIDKDNITIVNNCYRNDNGIETNSQNSFYISTMIRVKPLTYYTVTIASVHYSTRFYFLTKDGNWISRSAGYTTESAGIHNVWTQTPENCELMQLQFYKDSDISFLQVEEGKTKDLQDEIYNGKILSVIFPATGKNLFNSELELGGISITDGSDVETNTRIRTKEVIPIIVSQTHTISASGMYSVTVYGYDENMVFIGANRNKVLPYTFTFTKPNIKYVRFSFSVDAAGSVTSLSAISNVQLEYGSTATTYESVNNALYGGYIDLVNGTLVQTHAKFTEDGSVNTNTWTYVNTSFGAYYEKPLEYLGTLKPKYGYQKGIFNYLNSPLSGQSWQGAIGVNANSTTGNPAQNILRIILPKENFSSVNDIISYLSEHPLEMVYELATPITYQLTPQQLQTLKGQNHIWSSANGNIECTYEFIDHMAKRRLGLNTPHIEMVTNPVASFITDMKAPIKSLNIEFSPILAHSQEISPNAIGEIHGRTSIDYYFTDQLISFNPINFEELTSNGITAHKLGDSTFYFEGVAENHANFEYQITPITFYNNATHYFMFIIENHGLNFEGGQIGLAMYSNDTLVQTQVLTLSSGQIQIINNSRTWTDETRIIDKIKILIRKDLSNVILHIVYSATPIVANSINWQSTAGTIYGGYVDLIQKKVYSSYYQLPISSFTTSNIHKVTRFTDYDVYYFDMSELDIIPESETDVPYMFFENYKVVSWDERMNNTRAGIVAATALPSDYIRIQIFTEKDKYTTIEDFIASFTDRILLFKRKTPISYTINSIQLKTLKGTNNIWSSANGPVSIKYWTH